MGLVESSGDFLLQHAFSLTGATGKLILLMEGGDVGLHLGTDEVGHVRFRMEFVTVGTGDAAGLVGPLAFLTVLASLVVPVGDVAIVAHQRVSNAYISMRPASINDYEGNAQREGFYEGNKKYNANDEMGLVIATLFIARERYN